MFGSQSQTEPDSFWRRLSEAWGPKQIGWPNYFFLLVCVTAQLITISITWAVWRVRPLGDGVVPNLPWISGTPQFSTGALLVASLIFVLLSPRKLGMLLNLLLLGAAIAMDQVRCQPQVLALAFMMAACVWPLARRLCVWYLIAMWTWAGIHKFLSPDWFNEISCVLLAKTQHHLGAFGLNPGLDSIQYRSVFAMVIVLGEVATGVLAWFRPKLGAIACVLLHLGITGFLLLLGWNYSVLPWNLATATVGAWLLWTELGQRVQTDDEENGRAQTLRLPLPSSGWEKAVVIWMLLIPIGFYFGLVRHGFAHVLYSNNTPLCFINRSDRVEIIDIWKDLRVPFPSAEKAYLDYFRLTGQSQDTLHFRNRLAWLKRDQFFRHQGGRGVAKVTERDFLADQAQRPHVSVVEDPAEVFQLDVAGAKLKRRSQPGAVCVVQFVPSEFQPHHLELLANVPNVESVFLDDCNVSDADLKRIPVLRKLRGISLKGTPVTDQGLGHLAKQPVLRVVKHEGSAISDASYRSFIESMTGQKVLD